MTPGSETIPASVSFQALGTTVTVVVYGDRRAEAAAVEAVGAEVAAIDAACSRFRADSELSQVNAATGRPVAAGPVLLEAVAVALRAARLTNGVVDPTLGRTLRRLGYDRDFRALPASMLSPASSAFEGEAAAPVVTLVATAAPAWQHVVVDSDRGTVTVPSGVELDLGATAKALAVDRATAAAARAARAASAAASGPAASGAAETAPGAQAAPGVLVSIGGDLAVAGTPPPGGWSIRVADDHAAGPGAPGETIAITGGAVATSGTTVRRWYQGDTLVHHLVDPATGRPAAPVWRTVSVAAASCVDANTASTAAMILGHGAPDWLAAQGLPARLVTPEGEITTVCGWPEAS